MEFSILGPLEVSTEDGPVEVGPAKPRALLGLLLIHANQAISAEQLIDDLWEQHPPRSTTTTLQTYISQLRKRVGPALQTRPTGYLLEVEADRLDAARFERQVNEATTGALPPERVKAQLTAALGLWRGPALADFAGAHWAEPEAARLEGLRLLALEDRSEARLALGEHARLVPELETLVAAHPMRERLWAQLMLALYRADRQADALRTYTRLRALLAEELGIDPSAELARLEEAILLHKAELDWRPAGPELVATSAIEEPLGLPTGVVTFLLTDVVGSTQLWDQHPAAMGDALGRCDTIIADAARQHRGRVLKQRGEGDSSFVVFTRATDALGAALAAQRSLVDQAWPAGAELSVRMAIHTGEAMERDGDYYGTTVNRAARLRALAEGGQVVVSQSSVELLVDHLPDGIGLVELGSRPLRGLRRPEHVYAVSSAELQPPPATASKADLDESLSVPSALALPAAESFVGRTEELARLDQAWQAARRGERRVVLLGGEPGIGKTRVAAELASAAHHEGATVLYGRCDEDLGVPYQPFVEVLRHFIDHSAHRDLKPRLGHYGSELARLLPDLGERLPGLPAPISADPETERYRLFEAVASWLSVASEDRPLVLVLDDLHWATRPTILLLRHVLRSSDPKHLLVVGTYRDTELQSSHPLNELFGDLHGVPGVARVRLDGLDEQAVRSLLDSLGGPGIVEAESALTHTLFAATQGNPLFIREMLRHLAESGALHRGDRAFAGAGPRPDLGLPEGVRAVVARRVGRLTLSARRALAVASVAGPTFSLRLLERVPDAADDPETLLDAMDEAVAAHLLVEPPSAVGTYEFAHDLVRQVLYSGLSAARRARLHRRMGQALEALPDTRSQLGALANHFAAAAGDGDGDETKAVDYALLAGHRAIEHLAYEEAATLLERALHLIESGGSIDRTQRVRDLTTGAVRPDSNTARRSDVLLTLADVRRGLFDIPGMRQAALEAAVAARASRFPERLAKAALAFGSYAAPGMVDDEAMALCTEALDALGPGASATHAG